MTRDEESIHAAPEQAGAVVPVEAEQVSLSTLVRQQETLVEFVEKRNILLERALPLAMGVTKPEHWFKYGDSYWPSAAACQRIMRRFAVEMSQSRTEKIQAEDERGSYYIWNFYARFSLPGGLDALEALGSASSRNKFFAMKQGALRPLYEIAEPNIIKAARSNCIANGVQELLGIKGTTAADLEKAGINPGSIHEIEFKTAKDKGTAATAPKPQAPTGGKQTRTGTEAPPVSGDKDPGAIREKFLLYLVYLCFSLSAPEEHFLARYLPFRTPADDGSTHASRQMVTRFKKAKAVAWLESAVEKIEADEDLSGLQEWMDAQGVEDPNHGEIEY